MDGYPDIAPNAMVSCDKSIFNIWADYVSSLDQYINSQVLLQAQLALQDIDSALLSLTKASNIEPNDGKICKEPCPARWKFLSLLINRVILGEDLLVSTYTRNVDVTIGKFMSYLQHVRLCLGLCLQSFQGLSHVLLVQVLALCARMIWQLAISTWSCTLMWNL